MTRTYIPIAKLSRPSISGILSRQRLFKLLDAARKKHLTWISGPAGSGKTSLTASYLDDRKLPCIWYSVDGGDSDIAAFFYYMGMAAQKAAPRIRKPLPLLTPEYLPGLPVFTRRYFEQLCSRLSPPFTIIFDNYQDAPLGSQFSEMLASGITALPQGITMIVISRTEPPAAYARLRANEQISFIASDELRFTEDEARAVLKDKGRREAPEKLRMLLEKTQGWAAGLVLLTQGPGTGKEGLPAQGDIATNEVFDYFAGEIFDKTDADSQRFLIRSVFLTWMTAPLAEQLTGNRSAGRILSHLYRNHYFTEMRPEREPVFHFHPLFREFLLSRAGALLSQQERNALQRKAAGLLQETGHIEDAALLFTEAQDHQALSQLTLDHAAELARTGRLQTIKSWLAALPSDVLDQSPWHRYWSGICLLGIDPQGARRELDQAFHAFSVQKEPHGTLSAWSLIVDSYFFEWNEFRSLDAWISLFFDSLQDMLSAASDDIRARALTAIGMALMIRKPDHPDIERFIDQASFLAARSNDEDIKIHALMIANIYYSWTGDFERCNFLSDQIEGSQPSATMYPPYRLVSKVLQAGRMLWEISDIDAADRAVQEALDFGERNGLQVWDHMLFALGVNAALVVGDLMKAERYLERMRHTQSPVRKESIVHHHMMCCWFHFLKGHLNRALVEAEAAVKLSGETGYIFADVLCSYELSQVLHAMNDRRADIFLDKALALSVRAKSAILEFNCRIARAQYALESGNVDAGIGLLREAFSLGRKKRFFSLLWWWDPAAMARLATKALAWGIEPDYVRELIRIGKLRPPEPSMYSESWPWPLKIYTLGTFRIEKEGKPLIFAGKIQQKPLEMLKVLVALGGSGVRDEKIMEALWPDAEGDDAFQSYETTLHRLRKLLGIEKAVIRSEGRITLDPALCWVDAAAFERLLSEFESRRGPAEPSSGEAPLRQIEKALDLYRGNFLGGEKELPWLLSARERLRSRFMRAVAQAGALLEQAGQWQAAIEQYQKALEIDDLAEEFYQRLMACYGREGRQADVVAVYERCRKILTRTMGVEPSAGTTLLYKEILQRA